MSVQLLRVTLAGEADLLSIRHHLWHAAHLLGFAAADRLRLLVAVGALARVALRQATSGEISLGVDLAATPQRLEILVRDAGPGLGRAASRLSEARALVGIFESDTSPGRGTHIRLAEAIPGRRTWTRADLADIVGVLAQASADKPPADFEQQDADIREVIERLGGRDEDIERLRQELEDTNRGVVALYAELDMRAEQLREASELKSRFLSNMSHEFRTPLNSILALCGLLRDRVDGDLSAEQERQVSYIRRSAEDLLALVNDLLDLAKVEAGKLEVRPQAFRIEDLLSTLRGALRPLHRPEAVELAFTADSDLPELVTDEGKLAQILRNLVSNALKFTVQGRVAVHVSADSTRRDFIVIEVSDTGVGIPHDKLDIIFEEFGQVENPLQKTARGTGLGLPLSRRLAQLLGGDLGVQSAANEGSVFTVRVPVRAPGVAPEAADEPGRILVIDDDDTFRYVMAQTIRSCSNLDVIEARGVEEGLRLAHAQKPNIIALDLQMPEQDGFTLLERLAGDPMLRDVPVIVASSLLVSADVRARLPDSALLLPKQSLSRELVETLLRDAVARGRTHV